MTSYYNFLTIKLSSKVYHKMSSFEIFTQHNKRLSLFLSSNDIEKYIRFCCVTLVAIILVFVGFWCLEKKLVLSSTDSAQKLLFIFFLFVCEAGNRQLKSGVAILTFQLYRPEKNGFSNSVGFFFVLSICCLIFSFRVLSTRHPILRQ